MKLKVTNDIKNAMKGIFIYFVSNLVVFPVYHLIKGDFSWGDFFSIVLLNLIICLVIGAFFFVGMQVPENMKLIPIKGIGQLADYLREC